MNKLLYKGPSQLDPTSEIQLILSPTSKNAKTGPVSQTWILRTDDPPSAAIKAGTDQAICGDCPLRGGVCYVDAVRMGPNQIYRSQTEDWTTHQFSTPVQTRFGSYGDPAAIPRSVWSAFTHRRNLGYTRQWRTHTEFNDICMASVFTVQERQEAKDLGFRTYRIGHTTERGEIFCPYPKVTCQQCGLCNGNRLKAKDIVIPVHGASRKVSAFDTLLNSTI